MRARFGSSIGHSVLGAVAIGVFAFGASLQAADKGRASSADRSNNQAPQAGTIAGHHQGGAAGQVRNFEVVKVAADENVNVIRHGNANVAGAPGCAAVYSNTKQGAGIYDPVADLQGGFQLIRVGNSATGFWIADDWQLNLGPSLASVDGCSYEVALYGGNTACTACPPGSAPPFDAYVELFDHDPTFLLDGLMDTLGNCAGASPAGLGIAGTSASFLGLSGGTSLHVLNVNIAGVSLPPAIWVFLEITGSGRAGWIVGDDPFIAGQEGAEIGFSDNFFGYFGDTTADGLPDACGLFGFGPAPAPQSSFWGNAFGDSAATMALLPVRASGTQCVGVPTTLAAMNACDWYLNGDEIVLMRGGQYVDVEVRVSNWDADFPTDPDVLVAAYQARLDCTTFSSAKLGTLTPLAPDTDADGDPDECPGGGPFTGCTGSDNSRADHMTAAGGSWLPPACNLITDCPPEPDALVDPGYFACGAAALSGGATDNLPSRYGFQTAVAVSSNAHGTFFLGMDANPDETLLRDQFANPIEPIELLAAAITVQTGSCCTNIGPGTSLCTNNVTADECKALPTTNTQVYTVDGVCAGDVDGDGDDDSCPACQVDTDCVDGNSCTVDTCDTLTGVCSSGPPFVNGTQCCDPVPTDAADDAAGATSPDDLTTVDDGDLCTDDLCDPLTGDVSHSFNSAPCAIDDVPPGPGDGDPCTFDDTCVLGACVGTPLTSVSCVTDADCPNLICEEPVPPATEGHCLCVQTTKVTLDIDESTKPDGNCFPEGEKVYVHVNKGVGSDIVTGAQFLINYDPDCLDFKFVVDSVPGGQINPSAAFPLLIYTDVDENAGTIFVAVGITPGGSGTAGPATLATLQFDKLPGCGSCNLTFDSVNPQNTILSDATGQPATVELNESKDIRLSGEVTINVPESVTTNPDCGFPTAIVSWDPVTASDTCDGDIANECDEVDPNICCTNTHSGGVDIDHLAEAGGEFPQGTSTFCCSATKSCGNSTGDQCWTVTVSEQHSMDVVVQLSPVMMNVPSLVASASSSSRIACRTRPCGARTSCSARRMTSRVTTPPRSRCRRVSMRASRPLTACTRCAACRTLSASVINWWPSSRAIRSSAEIGWRMVTFTTAAGKTAATGMRSTSWTSACLSASIWTR